jgi:hypothetical protein
MLAAAVPGVRAHIRVIRAEDGKVLQTFSGACGLAFSSDSEVLVSQGWQTVRHWRIDPNPGRSTD